MNMVREIGRHLPKSIKVPVCGIINKLLFTIKSQTIYNLCKNYVDYYNNDNNCNIITNGELNFLKKNLRNCKTVFDVGANIGKWSKLVVEINNKVSLHCFELSRYTFRKLKDNIFSDNVRCNNFGLGAKKENRILYILMMEMDATLYTKGKDWNI